MAADKDLTACCLISGDGAVSGREYDSKWTLRSETRDDTTIPSRRRVESC